MENETKYRLNYCQICKNRTIDSQLNVICSLTNEIPNFENNCEKYNFDKITFNRKVEEIKTEIKEKYNPDTFFNKHLSGTYYDEYNEIKKSKYKAPHIGLKIYYHYRYFIGILAICLFTLVTLPIMYKPNLENQKYLIFFCIFLFLLAVYSIFALFFKEKKIFIETKEKSFIVKNKKEIFWNSIVSTGIYRISRKGGATIILILGTLNDGVIEILLESVDIEPQDLIKIIHLNVNAVQQRF